MQYNSLLKSSFEKNLLLYYQFSGFIIHFYQIDAFRQGADADFFIRKNGFFHDFFTGKVSDAHSARFFYAGNGKEGGGGIGSNRYFFYFFRKSRLIDRCGRAVLRGVGWLFVLFSGI